MTKVSTLHSEVKSESSPRLGSRTQSIVAGTLAGCITRSCTSPLDVLKIIVQVRHGHPHVHPHGPVHHLMTAAASSSVTTSSPASALFRSTSNALFHLTNAHVHGPATSVSTVASASVQSPAVAASAALNRSVLAGTIRNLYAHEGIRGFWRGNVAGCMRLGPHTGVKFFLFDLFQAEFALDANASNSKRASCGALSGLCATLTTYPLEVVRTRIITQTPGSPRQIRGVVHGMRHIVRHEGIAGLYKGSLSGILGSIPFEGVQFACYEWMKLAAMLNRFPSFRWPESKQELDALDFLVCGSISGAIAQTVAYPFDTVKKRLQNQSVRYYTGTFDCFRRVIQEEGVGALYRGTLPNLVRIAPYAAVMFSSYETIKRFLASA